VPPGLPRKAAKASIEDAIETESAKLIAEAGVQSVNGVINNPGK
jgi:hypothetical protein